MKNRGNDLTFEEEEENCYLGCDAVFIQSQKEGKKEPLRFAADQIIA